MSPSEARIPLPKAWPIRVRVAILHVIALAQFATALTRSWAANSINARLREEIRIKDARVAAINPHRSSPLSADGTIGNPEVKGGARLVVGADGSRLSGHGTKHRFLAWPS